MRAILQWRVDMMIELEDRLTSGEEREFKKQGSLRALSERPLYVVTFFPEAETYIGALGQSVNILHKITNYATHRALEVTVKEVR